MNLKKTFNKLAVGDVVKYPDGERLLVLKVNKDGTKHFGQVCEGGGEDLIHVHGIPYLAVWNDHLGGPVNKFGVQFLYWGQDLVIERASMISLAIQFSSLVTNDHVEAVVEKVNQEDPRLNEVVKVLELSCTDHRVAEIIGALRAIGVEITEEQEGLVVLASEALEPEDDLVGMGFVVVERHVHTPR